MSSQTKAEYITELQARSSVLSGFPDSTLGIFIDIALRAYSKRLPELRVSPDNAVVSGQELYDYPSGALRIIKLRSSSTNAQISFVIENQGNGEKIKLGNVVISSYASLLDKGYYAHPLSTQQGSGSQETYTAFDIEYAILQTIATIKDTGLEALTCYIEHLAYEDKGEEADAEVETPASITDRSSDGASTTVSYVDRGKRLRERGDKALARFDKLTRTPYGTRG